MTKNDLKSFLKLAFVLVGLYILLMVFVPRSSASNAFVDHFTMVKDAVMGDGLFYIFVLALVGILYYFLIYRPQKSKRKNKEISTIRVAAFLIVVGYAILLVVLPYLTVAVTAPAYWITIVDHFILVKDVIQSDFVFLVLAAGLMSGLYYFLVYKPKV